ncbi:hypothetical protein PI124_g21431 [Phytophthora idaei]|nr:hypothetical protein PI125_g23065 [Phytophthora idaei]KAG3138680.1 hypothetical protein PI126_g16811 [Phytophthora idaei]KAG3233496.1 hypothetical protein PI124_g21431 [Phytophthora idaei]
MDLRRHVHQVHRDARYEVPCTLDVLEHGHASLLQRQESRALDSLVLGRLERESQVCLHGRHGREAGSVDHEFAERPFLLLPRQLGEQKARTRELGRQLPSLNGDVHFTEPPVQMKATVAFTTVSRDIELNDVGLVLGRRGSRHSLTKVSEFTRYERLGGQALLSLGAGR